VLAAAFLLRAFQQLFITTSRRFKQPESSNFHPVKTERLIALVICSMLIGTGFYTTPWLNFIDQEMTAIHQHYPMHGEQTMKSQTQPLQIP
jgi:NADH-quinone oxidoreductase subunit M